MASLRVDVITIFPGMFQGPLDHGVIGRARESGLLDVRIRDLRDWTRDRHRTVDDEAFGGASGMLLKPEPLAAAIEELREDSAWVVLLSPQGRPLSHSVAASLAKRNHLLLACGRYEGVDERVRTLLVDQEVSVGDFVLTGGELAAMVLIDAVARFVPGVIGRGEAVESDSHAAGLLEHPQFTRPRTFRGIDAPKILLSGDHGEIARWRHRESLRRTLLRRPDLLLKRGLSAEETGWLSLHEPAAFEGLLRLTSGLIPGARLDKREES